MAAANKWKVRMRHEGYTVDEELHSALLKEYEGVVLRSPEPTSPTRGAYKSDTHPPTSVGTASHCLYAALGYFPVGIVAVCLII